MTLIAFGTQSAAAQSTTTSINVPVVILPLEGELSDDFREYGKKDAFIKQRVVAPRSIVLKDEVLLKAHPNSVHLDAGTPLFGFYRKSAWTYCAISGVTAGSAITQLLFASFPDDLVACFQDENGDGVLDIGWSGSKPMKSAALFTFDLYGPREVSPHPRYEAIDYQEGPSIPLSIRWSKGKSGQITLSEKIGDYDLTKKTIVLPAVGGPPVKVSLDGATIEIAGYDPQNETIKARVINGLPRTYTILTPKRIITTTYSYVPVYY